MRQYAVIVAGGSGSRMGGGLPKQFRSLLNRPILWWSLKAFHDENPSTSLILVLPGQYISIWQEMFNTLPEEDQFNHKVITGGATRSESVNNGLSLIEDEDALVAVHDAARPLVSNNLIGRGWEEAEKAGAAIPVIPITDSLRKLMENGNSEWVERSRYVAVQTPQVFLTKVLKKAFESISDSSVFTDEASMVQSIGHSISLFEGDLLNMKVTNPEDMDIASLLMSKYRMIRE